MFSRRTVFVIGAGAGVDIGMPVGTDLAARIAKRLNILYDDFGRPKWDHGDPAIIECLRQAKYPGLDVYQKAGWKIRDGIVLANSIDDFLDLHQEDEAVVRMGKMAIIRSIIEAESQSKLSYKVEHVNSTIDFLKIDGSWLVKMMKMMAPGRRKMEEMFENVTFVNFNYDRCLEHFLEHAVSRLFNIERLRALEICKQTPIFHPYGSIGSLPGWGSDPIAFGHMTQAQDLLSVSERIKTYTEQIEDAATLNRIRAAIREAEQIIFLGFGFHAQNMNLLTPQEKSPGAEVFATAFGVGEEDCDVVRDEIGKFFPNRPPRHPGRKSVRVIKNLDCSSLFDQYHKSLQSSVGKRQI